MVLGVGADQICGSAGDVVVGRAAAVRRRRPRPGACSASFACGRGRDRGPSSCAWPMRSRRRSRSRTTSATRTSFFLPGHFLAALAIAAGIGHWQPARVRHAMIVRWRCCTRDGGAGTPGPPSIATPIVAPMRISRAWPRASTDRTRSSSRRWTGSSRTSCSIPLATNGATSPGRGSTTSCSTFRFSSRDNLAESRDIVLTADAAKDVVAAYATEFPLVARSAHPRRRLADVVSRIPRGAPYVLTLLLPAPSGRTIDQEDLHEGDWRMLTGQSGPDTVRGPYQVWAGSAR